MENTEANMKKQPMHELFEAMYHGNPSFEDFLHTSMAENYEVVFAGKRKIVKPKEDLKIYHKFLNLFLVEFLPINSEVVFSYRKGFGALHAVEKHRHSKFFFQTDISAFFESVDIDLVRNTILAGADHCPIEDVGTYIDRIVELICLADSLPIGFPVSAPLSNCVLYSFDNQMEEMCGSLDLEYSRYADDVIVSAQSLSDLSQMERKVQERLHKYGSEKLNINQSKTRYFQVGNKVKILGMMVLPNGKITPDTKKKKEIEFLLHFYLTDRPKFNRMIAEMRARPGKEVKIREDEYPAVLSGNINYVDSIDPDYTNKLRRKFGAATIDMLMHTGFTNKK